MNTLRQRFADYLSSNIPGVALLLWTLLLILVGIDAFASVSYLLFLYYPVQSVIVWAIIGAFVKDKVRQTIKLGLVAHGIVLVSALLIVLFAWGRDYFALEIVAILIFVFVSALLSSLFVLISNAVANRIRGWFANRKQQQ